jgi:hypothetical protein
MGIRTMDQKVVIDCSTGEHTWHELTPQDVSHRDALRAEHADRETQTHASQDAHHAVLTQVAASAGVPVDDLKAALGQGSN